MYTFMGEDHGKGVGERKEKNSMTTEKVISKLKLIKENNQTKIISHKCYKK